MTNKKLIMQVANDLKLKPNDNIIEGLTKSWAFFEKSLKMLDEVDTENIPPLYSPNFTPVSYLREDECEDNNFNVDVVLKNSHHAKNNYIIIKKVIK